MELQSGWWGGYKMAVGSVRICSTSQQWPAWHRETETQTNATTGQVHALGLWKYLSEGKSTYLKKKQKIKHSMVFEIKIKKSFEYLHDESLSTKLCMGVAMPGFGCRSNTAHRLGKYHAVHSWGPGKHGLATAAAAMGNQLSNNKTWHRIRALAFLTVCHNVRICIVTWRGWALFLDRHPEIH